SKKPGKCANFFTSLDLTDAYTQLSLDPESQELCVLNTHKGLYKLTRLIYGFSSAAAIFQSTIDQILKDVDDVICYLDNILIKGLQHWSTILQSFNYKIIHKKAHLMTVPDALSRLPSSQTLNYVSPLIKTPITIDRISEASLSDPLLKLVIDFFGWPQKNPHKSNPEFSRYFKVRDFLSLSQKCLLIGNQVVIPPSLSAECLNLMHMSHPGIVRTKMLARSVLWWPSLSQDIESLCNNCAACAKENFKPTVTYTPWVPAKYPFERVHVDFYSSQQSNFFIYCDSFSKWMHIQLMSSTFASEVNSALFSIFALWGCLPTILVSDSGPPFHSVEFVNFLTRFNIVIKHSPIYHPEANSVAERGVGISKNALEKLLNELQTIRQVNNVITANSLLDRINTFLFTLIILHLR
ncbi:LOW QUALITY PROTEIN: hypothetical protein KUF71_015022, partial [Frankliniella fusca]